MLFKLSKLTLLWLLHLMLLSACSDKPWNDPYPSDDPKANTLYTSFTERPKHLDPAVSYSSNEWVILNQIYEPPLQYHYLKRPYTLEALTAEELPKVSYLDKNYQLTHSEKNIAYTQYQIKIKPNIFYQMHPCFYQEKNQYVYHDLKASRLKNFDTLEDFPHSGTREVVAADYVFQIKRLADPLVKSPILGLMQQHIVGLGELAEKLQKKHKALNSTLEHPVFVDLNTIDIVGAKALDKYTYEITLNGQYPQFIYWLAMPFFAPMPWEAIKFYSHPTLVEKDIILDWFPVGTGPYYLEKNNPNAQIVLQRNKLFRNSIYPILRDNAEKSQYQEYQTLMGQPIPFLDRVEFILEKEDIPYWNKFLQGYYDSSGVSSDSFDQAFQSSGTAGGLQLTEPMLAKKIKLTTDVLPTTFYWGFNMLDPTVGGISEKNKKLRQALSIAMDIEEYITIFLNGRGIAAQSLLPPGMSQSMPDNLDFNAVVYQKPKVKKSLAQAEVLLTEAGYSNGVDPKTGKPLILYYDAIQGAGPDTKAQFDWIRKQFSKLGIDLIIRATQYNRFQDKMRTGEAQIFFWGWNADYPDPENFLFLLYGPNGKVKFGGENPANYNNPTYDALYEKMRNLPDGPERAKILGQMLDIIREDAPWIWGVHPNSYALSHQWLYPSKPNAMSHNNLKYIKINPELRAQKRVEWNQAHWWPLGFMFMAGIVGCLPAWISYRAKQYRPLNRFKLK
jgi:oligopeptide transport system substrate-binding protein